MQVKQVEQVIALFQKAGLSNIRLIEPLPGLDKGKIYFLTAAATLDLLTLSNVEGDIEEILSTEVMIITEDGLAADYKSDVMRLKSTPFATKNIKEINLFIEDVVSPQSLQNQIKQQIHQSADTKPSRPSTFWESKQTKKIKKNPNPKTNVLVNQLLDYIKENPLFWPELQDNPTLLIDLQKEVINSKRDEITFSSI